MQLLHKSEWERQEENTERQREIEREREERRRDNYRFIDRPIDQSLTLQLTINQGRQSVAHIDALLQNEHRFVLGILRIAARGQETVAGYRFADLQRESRELGNCSNNNYNRHQLQSITCVTCISFLTTSRPSMWSNTVCRNGSAIIDNLSLSRCQMSTRDSSMAIMETCKKEGNRLTSNIWLITFIDVFSTYLKIVIGRYAKPFGRV